MSSKRIEWIIEEISNGQQLSKEDFEKRQKEEEAERIVDSVRDHLKYLRAEYLTGEISLHGPMGNRLMDLGLDHVGGRGSSLELIDSISELFRKLIGKIQRLSYRSLKNRSNVDVKELSGSSLDFLVQDIQAKILLFAQNEIDLTGVPLLNLWLHDLEYWQGILTDIEISQFFADTPSIVKHACVHNPIEPEGYLRRVMDKFKEISKDTEFREFFADTSSIVKHACVRYPTDPEGYLRRVMDKFKEISENADFREFFADTPSIVKHACVRNPIEPEGFLRRVMAKFKEISENADFREFFADTLSIVKYACVRYHTDPEGYSRRVMAKFKEISENAEFRDFFADTLSIIKYACVRYPTDPEGYLSRLMKSSSGSDKPELPPLICTDDLDSEF
jgi:hypothetical protein